MNETIYDSIVVGSGPAGMTAALYLLRAGKSVLLLESEGIGGQAATSPRLENYPSIVSISGEEFADNLFTQIQNLGVEFDLSEAKEIKKEGDLFRLIGDSSEYLGKTIILATGCKHRHLGLAREEELTGHGVSYCATCDGAFFQGEDVVIIGDANSALQYAISLSAICHHVEIVTLFDRYFADPILVERLSEIENVHAIHEWKSLSFEGDHELTGVTFQNTQTNEVKTIHCKGCFIAIGQIPDCERFHPWVDLEKGFIVADENGKTKTDGIFAAGDCRVKSVRQVATAIGDGANAAMSALRYLDLAR